MTKKKKLKIFFYLWEVQQSRNVRENLRKVDKKEKVEKFLLFVGGSTIKVSSSSLLRLVLFSTFSF
ncbi:hypothetical protein LguiB_026028 [Lonicera macranthoides]